MVNSVVQNDASVLTQQQVSLFAIKRDDPTAMLEFKGLMRVDGLTNPVGDITPIRIPNPAQYGSYVTVGLTRAAPDLNELTLVEYVSINKKSTLEKMAKELCAWAFVIKMGQCGRPDSLADWKSLLLADYTFLTENDYGTLQQFDSSEPVEISGTASFVNLDRLLPLQLEEQANSIVVSTVVDVIYADQLSCGSCAPYSSGCAMRFALANVNPSSVGLSAQVVFTKNGQSYNTEDVNSLAGANGTSITALGLYLIVTQETSTAQHHYALKSAVTNTPNSYNWTAVSTGYQSGGGGRCAVTDGVARLFIGGAGGYVYGTDNPTDSVTVIHDASLTTQNLNAIAHANGNLLAVGNNNAVLLSTNAGSDLGSVSFTSITGPEVGVNLTACEIFSASYFTIGTATGKLWYTQDGGSTWTQRGLPVTLSTINDIAFSPDFPLVGAIAGQTATRGYILRTFDGGHSWYYSKPAIGQLSTAPEKYNAVALCGVNAVFTGGKKASSTDGILAEASS
jgi:hypothetical protein